MQLKPGDIIYYVPDCLYGPVVTYRVIRYSYGCIVLSDGVNEKVFNPPLTTYYNTLREAEEERLRQITNRMIYIETKINNMHLELEILRRSMNLKGVERV